LAALSSRFRISGPTMKLSRMAVTAAPAARKVM
jgi:hypothetical protein